MNRFINLSKRTVVYPLFYWIACIGQAMAAIPQPGKDMIPDKSKDFIDIFLLWLKKGGPLVVGVVGVAVLTGALVVLYKAYQKGQEMGDNGLFMRQLLPGGILVMMAIGLLYLATQYYG